MFITLNFRDRPSLYNSKCFYILLSIYFFKLGSVHLNVISGFGDIIENFIKRHLIHIREISDIGSKGSKWGPLGPKRTSPAR